MEIAVREKKMRVKREQRVEPRVEKKEGREKEREGNGGKGEKKE